jgi:hypothetical protein
MAEVKVENRVCAGCGVDVRPDTQFCYNCGTSVEIPAEERAEAAEQFQRVDDHPVSLNGHADPTGDRRPAPPEYRSAAGLRRSRKEARKPIPAAWEPGNESVEKTFIIATIVLLGFAVTAIFLMLYFK